MVGSEGVSRRAGTLWMLNLDWPAPSGVAPRIPVALARLRVEDAESLSRAMGHDDPAYVLERLSTDRRCYAARVEGEIAAYCWVSFGEESIGEIRLRIRLAAGEAYIWDCATAPAFRRRRLYTALLAHIAGGLRAEGLCRVWIGADTDNLASHNSFALADFRPVADLIVARALGVRLLWVRGRPGVPQGWVADARRALLGNRDRAWLAAPA